ncbi:hypothetical protein CHUAL_002937 [Chamberlinius hualienensis]
MLGVHFALLIVFVAFGSHLCAGQCSDQCIATIVESIPDNLTYPDGSPQFPSTYSAWSNLLDLATSSIHIASYYWTLRYDGEAIPISLDDQGEAIFNGLMDAGLNRGIDIQIVQNQPDEYDPDIDSLELASRGAATVRNISFPSLVGAGILHTKFWIVDLTHVYIGSANMDWESLTQVKELGLMLYNCSCLAQDLEKIFQIYWLLAVPDAVIPPVFPSEYETNYNSSNPLQVSLNNTDSRVYLGSSPPQMCTEQRTTDVDAILNVMDSAEEFVYISVMDYYPLIIYDVPRYQYWSVIDNKIREVAISRGVHVKLLISHWNHTHHDLPYYLNSLAVISNTYDDVDVEVRLFVVPAFTEIQAQINYGRVNHAKYMVTDNAAYIGTSNWSGDYFVNTGGVSVIVNQTDPNNASAQQPIREQLQSIFDRDWNSEYVHPLSDFL